MEKAYHFTKDISLLYRYNQAALARELEGLGLSAGQYPYIIVVCRSPGITQDGLTSRLMLNKSSVARAIAQLEEGGFLRRETDPADRRVYRLYPTPRGEESLEELLGLLGALNRELTRDFSQEEKETLQRLLGRLAETARRDWCNRGEGGEKHRTGEAQQPLRKE